MENDLVINKSSYRTNFKKINISIVCEWLGCQFACYEMNKFQEHLIEHLRFACTEVDDANVINCGICMETLNTDFSSLRHMFYHAYHIRLKCRGSYIMNQNGLPLCTLDSYSVNIVPCLVQPFICQWTNCNYSNDNVCAFYDHVDYHPIAELNKGVHLTSYDCKWSDCTYTAKTTQQIQVHLSFHCEKRYVACPTCGLTFSNTSKFSDHLKRQIVSVWNKQMQDEEMNGVLSTLANTYNPVIPIPKPLVAAPKEAFKCNLCMHLFATKKLLKYHEVRHVSTLSCRHCNHTCSSRHALKRHILFRHTEEKPFKCFDCDMAFKCNDGLKRHTKAIHEKEEELKNLMCDIPDCVYVAKDLRGLNIHKSRLHCKIQLITTKVFVCHQCDQEYVKGAYLTDHLSSEHGINKTPESYRHQYKICEDGKYRLKMFNLKLKINDNDQNEGDRNEIHEYIDF